MRFLSANITVGLQMQRYNFFPISQKDFSRGAFLLPTASCDKAMPFYPISVIRLSRTQAKAVRKQSGKHLE